MVIGRMELDCSKIDQGVRLFTPLKVVARVHFCYSVGHWHVQFRWTVTLPN